jgi:hypothetical protein
MREKNGGKFKALRRKKYFLWMSELQASERVRRSEKKKNYGKSGE